MKATATIDRYDTAEVKSKNLSVFRMAEGMKARIWMTKA